MGDEFVHDPGVRRGQQIPLGYALDAKGRQTTDAHAALDGGTVQPIGGPKGSALAMLMDMMGGVISGASPTRATSMEAEGPGPKGGEGRRRPPRKRKSVLTTSISPADEMNLKHKAAILSRNQQRS
jgi:hypothetical protein